MPRRESSLASILAGSQSKSFRELNAALYGASPADLAQLPGAIAERTKFNAAGRADSVQAKGQGSMDGCNRARNGDGPKRVARQGPRVRVHLVSFRRPGTPLDRDNLIGGSKALRDHVARWLGLDDSERFIAWEYSQCETRGQRGTAVSIEIIA
jgi:hypothetical protein